MLLARAALGEVRSNVPLSPEEAIGPDLTAAAHTFVDFGDDALTVGRAHPMIDPSLRLDHLRRAGADPDTAVILLDVVLGHGSHADPAGELAPVCAEIMQGGDGPQVVAYVLGTEGDPQGFEGQRAKLRDAGCVVTETAARASLAAAAIVLRDTSVL